MGQIGSGQYVKLEFLIEVPVEMQGEAKAQECLGWMMSSFQVSVPLLDYLRTSGAGFVKPDDLPPEFKSGLAKSKLRLQ